MVKFWNNILIVSSFFAFHFTHVKWLVQSSRSFGLHYKSVSQVFHVPNKRELNKKQPNFLLTFENLRRLYLYQILSCHIDCQMADGFIIIWVNSAKFRVHSWGLSTAGQFLFHTFNKAQLSSKYFNQRSCSFISDAESESEPLPIGPAPPPDFNQPQSNYNQPQPNYSQLLPNYGQQNPNYGQQQPNYGQQESNYGSQIQPHYASLLPQSPAPSLYTVSWVLESKLSFGKNANAIATDSI